MVLALLALALLHARRGAPFSPAMAEPAPSATARTRGTLLAPVWQKRWWIDKTARLLRGGEGLVRTTMSVPCCRSPRQRSRIASWRMQRFGDAMLDFNLFFLGFTSDHRRPAAITIVRCLTSQRRRGRPGAAEGWR